MGTDEQTPWCPHTWGGVTLMMSTLAPTVRSYLLTEEIRLKIHSISVSLTDIPYSNSSDHFPNTLSEFEALLLGKPKLRQFLVCIRSITWDGLGR